MEGGGECLVFGQVVEGAPPTPVGGAPPCAFVSDGVWVIDCGVLAYSERDSEIEGDARLGILFEETCDLASTRPSTLRGTTKFPAFQR